jgi:23S rRNA pseudouridine2605 synthase
MRKQMTKKSQDKEPIRLTKIIADSGIASRRGAEKLIEHGEVVLNGKVVTNPGTKAIFGVDAIKISDRLLTTKEAKAYYLFNKPSKCVSTMFDTQDRECLSDFTKKIKAKVLPCGSLGYFAAGALILTNDGELNAVLSKKTTPITKTYKLKVSGTPKPTTIQKLGRRIRNTDANPELTRVKFSQKTQKNAWVEITITSVSTAQIEIAFRNTGMPIQKWVRSKFGAISTAKLLPGMIRRLTTHEVTHLKRFLTLKKIPKGRVKKK